MFVKKIPKYEFQQSILYMAERFFEDKTNKYGYTVKVVKPHNLLHIGFFIVIIKL